MALSVSRQAVMHGGDRVEQVAEVGEIGGRAVDLQRLQQALERLRVVAGLMVDDADQVQRPDLDDGRGTAPGQVAGLERQPERLVELAELIGDAGQAIQRLGFAGLVAVRAGQNPGLLHQRSRPDQVVGLGACAPHQEGRGRTCRCPPLPSEMSRTSPTIDQPFGPPRTT